MSKVLLKNLWASLSCAVLSYILLCINLNLYIIEVTCTILLFVAYFVASELLPEYATKIVGSNKSFKVTVIRTIIGNVFGIIVYILTRGVWV